MNSPFQYPPFFFLSIPSTSPFGACFWAEKNAYNSHEGYNAVHISSVLPANPGNVFQSVYAAGKYLFTCRP